ncbi:MAG: helix-turn-helix domain-containing protein [Coriobacteriaceae bacterium]
MHSGVERVDRFSLREAYKSAGLNQAKVAHALEVSPSTVSGFESGRCELGVRGEVFRLGTREHADRCRRPMKRLLTSIGASIFIEMLQRASTSATPPTEKCRLSSPHGYSTGICDINLSNLATRLSLRSATPPSCK